LIIGASAFMATLLCLIQQGRNGAVVSK